MTVDFQALVDGMAAMTCVVSVEKLPDGSCGTIRIVTGNPTYIDSIENPPGDMRMLTQKFVPNSEYTNYFTRDLNFEEYCYQAAVHKRCLHSYAHPERLNVWFNMTFLPLDADEGNLSYCTYTMEINFEASSERLSNVSGAVAASVLEQAVTLRSTNDFASAMESVVDDIRELCEAEFSCVLLTDEEERTCSVLAESLAEGSSLRSMEVYIDEDFYELVESWESAISGSNCLIAKDEHDMQVVRERNPGWYASLASASVESIVLFPLKSHGQLLGYIWAVNFNPESSMKIKETLELATYVLAAEIDNYLLLGRLKKLGSTDKLTGLLNRNEMDNRINALKSGERGVGAPVGVVFADVNGLKAVNDEGSHAAGDRLLKAATAALLQVFDRDSVYRAGGDEFVVILEGISADELSGMVDAIRNAAENFGEVSFAIGTCLEEDSRDIERAVRIADERMYEDKRIYYANRG